MAIITEEEENLLDEGKELILEKRGNNFHIHDNNIYCYGKVDFNKGSEDCKQIATFNFLNHLSWRGVPIPSDYDYEHHECYSPINKYRWAETWKPEVLAKYAHACLNKPERIVLFKKLL